MLLFQTASDKLLKAIYQKRIATNPKIPKNDHDGLKKMCADPDYGYFFTDLSFKSHTSSMTCAASQIPEAYSAVTQTMAVEKFSPYKRLIDIQ